MGLMLGIIVEEGKHSVFANKLIENGVLAITAGKNAVRLLPPLTISKEEMDEALSIMAKSLLRESEEWRVKSEEKVHSAENLHSPLLNLHSIKRGFYNEAFTEAA